jgi:ribosomal protein S10
MKITLNIKSTNKLFLFCYVTFLKKILLKYCVGCKNFYSLAKIKKITLLKSSHVNKRAKESFESRYYNCILVVENLKTLNFLKFIVLNKPAGVHLKLKVLGRII